MAINVVYAVTSAMIDGYRVSFGESWYADDPLVKANPTLFSTDPRKGGLRTTAPLPETDLIERATAAPGEKRGAVKRG